ncbi:protein FAR1-RELATED SEQUENCE 5-like [Arachis hypogaea]|uniref:protein FAR1-RELATED SEQUENCE 5-like n=1 Tax=Arachis hypogaea TaxID=3818 RepID=UPI000DECACAC|nr:protein FAR1-RELATED SEQUENCE 5-like [Arachis hypogaea]
MENDGKESYKDGDQYEDLSVEYECSSDESDDMVDHLKRDNWQREHRAITRVNCRARIRFIRHYRTGKWKVSVFESEHNHPLCPAKYRHLITANRGLNEADKTQADSLRACGVKTCHIMGYMVSQKGGYDKVGFTSKYLHNHISKTRRGKVKDGDAFATLAYLLSKADSDLLFLGKFTLKDGRLDSLVWVDGANVVDYECFGDVLAFDTTYKKNVYNKPLVIFSGTNHHGQTTIFGCAMLLDERSETFKWALKKFLEIMSEKPPGGVVTDGDHATREAILEVFPRIPHRLCARHLHRNAVQNIKNKHFWDDFNILLYGQCTVQIFEERWSEIISKYGLAENEWVQGIYNDKMKWATTYLREHFFGRIRATSQCEEIHSLLKNYVDSKTSLLEFMHKCSEVLRHYQNNHLTANFETFYKFSVLTTCLESFEKQAAELYTRNIFKLVKDEIEAAGALNVTECPNSGDIVEYNTSEYFNQQWQFKVAYNKDNDLFACECRLFETRGLPCSHIFGVLKYHNTKCVPSSLILKRWTRDAKIDFICSIGEQDSADDIVPTLRCGAMASIC